MGNAKVALVHDQLGVFGGAERVLIELHKLYSDAPVYVAYYDEKQLGSAAAHFAGWDIRQSWAARMPLFKRFYSIFRFMMPYVWESIDLSSYDIVISSTSWAMSKGVLTRPQTTHISYIHTPPRYLYGYDESPLRRHWLVRQYALLVNHGLLQWDYLSSQRPDYFIANSAEVAARVKKFYRRESTVIHPPISGQNSKSEISIFDKATVDKGNPKSESKLEHESAEILNRGPDPESSSGLRSASVQDDAKKAKSQKPTASDYYLTVSRLVHTKHIDVLVQAANEAKFKLKVVGTGPQEEYLRSLAGDTVEFLGHVSDEDLAELYAGAKAFLYASVDEDFGMVPVESMAYGVPVIAYASGGVRETVTTERGVPFTQLTPGAVVESVHKLESMKPEQKDQLIKNAKAFADSCSSEEFGKKMKEFISSHA